MAEVPQFGTLVLFPQEVLHRRIHRAYALAHDPRGAAVALCSV